MTPEVGTLVDVDDVDGLAGTLRKMRAEAADFDPSLLHAYAAERFSPYVVGQQLLSVYEEAQAAFLAREGR